MLLYTPHPNPNPNYPNPNPNQAVENGARDGYGRSAELLGAYLRDRAGGGGKDGGKGGGKGGEGPCRAAVEATPDAAVSVGSLMSDIQP